jgi:hypothetical protein
MGQNFGNIILLFSDYTPQNGAVENIRITLPKFHSHLDIASRHKHAFSVTLRLFRKGQF